MDVYKQIKLHENLYLMLLNKLVQVVLVNSCVKDEQDMKNKNLV